jgi:hypothetical protein
MTQSSVERLEILLIIRGYAATLTMTLLTVVTLYLSHWYWFRKIEDLEP